MIANKLAKKYKISRKEIEEVFNAQVDLTAENIKLQRNTRWTYIGSFVYNKARKKHLDNQRGMSPEERKKYRLLIRQKHNETS